jgi:Ca-activated chloride channel family protein
MRVFFANICLLILCLSSLAQSGRVKQDPEEPASARPRSATSEPQPITNSRSRYPKTSPTPAKTPSAKNSDDDDEVIQINSILIPVPVSVTDENGAPVSTLQVRDFELSVDNNPAEIGELSRSNAPVRMALLFDNSSSLTTAREFEIKAATRFFKRVLRPDLDMAALYSVATSVNLEQPMTKNTGSLVSAINSLPPPAGATALLDAIVEASRYLGDFEGRRVIVIVSDGEDTVSDIETTLEKVMRSVQSRNCQVYVVKTTDFENYTKLGRRAGNANLMNLIAEHRMAELAKQTGGAVHSPLDEKELDIAFNRISAELSEQYILSYYPDDKASSGDFHTIALKVKNRPGLTVRTRKGYIVPAKK